MHLSQVQLRIADLWKGAFESELLLKVGEEIINFVINATVLEAVIKKKTQKHNVFKKSENPLILFTF